MKLCCEIAPAPSRGHLSPAFAQAPKKQSSLLPGRRNSMASFGKFRSAGLLKGQRFPPAVRRHVPVGRFSCNDGFYFRTGPQFRERFISARLHVKKPVRVSRGKAVYDRDGYTTTTLLFFGQQDLRLHQERPPGFLFSKIGVTTIMRQPAGPAGAPLKDAYVHSSTRKAAIHFRTGMLRLGHGRSSRYSVFRSLPRSITVFWAAVKSAPFR